MIIAMALPVLIAVSTNSFNVQYKCGEAADKTRLCVISEEQLEALITANNQAVSKLHEIKESKACKFVDASLKAIQ